MVWEQYFFPRCWVPLLSCTPPKHWCIAAGGCDVQKPISEISGFIWDQKHWTLLLIWSPFYFLCTFFHWVDCEFYSTRFHIHFCSRYMWLLTIYILNEKLLSDLCIYVSPKKRQPSEMTSTGSSIFLADHGGHATNVSKTAAWPTVQCATEIGFPSTYFLYVMRKFSGVSTIALILSSRGLKGPGYPWHCV